MFLAALFTIAKTWKQSKCPSTDNWLKKMWCTHTHKIEYQPQKKNEILHLHQCGCREGNGNPLQYSCLENFMNGGAWQAAVHGVTKSQTRLSGFTFTFHFNALEKEMATHSSVLAWRIPGTGEPGGLPSLGLHRVGRD